MSGTRGYLLVTALVVAFTWTLDRALSADTSVRNVEIFTEMVYSRAYEPLSSNPLLPGGLTQQPLVDGVVARGALPFPYAEGPDEAGRAGRELASPLAGLEGAEAAAARERGSALYAIYCVGCHDARGDGRGPVVEHGMVPPPSLHAARATQMPDGEMFHVLTRGQGNMSSFAAQLTEEERWQVVLHVRHLQAEAAR